MSSTNMDLLKHSKAQGIIAAIFIVLVLSLFGLVGVSLLGTKTIGSSLETLQSSQAFFLARAGIEAYAQRLADMDISWDDIADYNGTLGAGSYKVEVLSTGDGFKRIKSTGIVPGFNADITRYQEVTVRQLPFASNLALFQRAAGAAGNLTINSSTIDGDSFANGNVTCSSVTVNNGKLYVPNGNSVTGLDSSKWKAFDSSPAPSMPEFNTAYYANLINTYNGKINGTSGSTLNIGYDINLNDYPDNTLESAQDINFYGKIAITGHGTIVAGNDVNIGAWQNSKITITPEAGSSIEILAGRNLNIAPDRVCWDELCFSVKNVIVDINPGTILYSRNPTTDNRTLIQKNGTRTQIKEALIIGNRKVIVQNGTNIENSTLYLGYPIGVNQGYRGNYLQIAGNGTSVSGNIISTGIRWEFEVWDFQPALIINDRATVRGLVYYNDLLDVGGRAQIGGDADITGSVIVESLQDNTLGPATITYDESVIPGQPPVKGFSGYVTYEPNSWDGL